MRTGAGGSIVGVSVDRETIMAERRRSQRVVQVTLGLLALASLASGLAIYALGARLGIPADTARVVASAFLIAAIIDALMLYGWERLFPARGGD